MATVPYPSHGELDWDTPLKAYLDDQFANNSATWLNVKSSVFGARGDGVTDDRPAIQAAIDAAALVGGVVFFPAGTYLVGQGGTIGGRPYGLLVKSGVKLAGASIASTIKAKNSSNIDIITTDRSGATTTNVAIIDLTIDGNNTNQAGTGFSVWFFKVTDLSVNNVRIFNSAAWSLRIELCTRVRIQGYEANSVAAGTAGSDGLHFKDTNQVTGGNINIYTETDDAFVIEAVNQDVSDYALSEIYVQPKHTTVAAGLRGIMLMGDQTVMNGAWTISNVNLSSVVVKNSGGQAVACIGASYKNVKINAVSDGCVSDLYLQPGNSIFAGSMWNCSFDVVGRNCTSASLNSVYASQAFGTIRGNKINAVISNPADAIAAVLLDGSYWTGSIAVDYDPNATKVSKQQGIVIYGTFNSLDLQARDASNNIQLQSSAASNTFRLGPLTGGVSFDVWIDPAALNNRFIGGSVTKTSAGSFDPSNRFIGVKGVAVPSTTLPYSASISTDASKGEDFLIVATNGTAFTIASPTNPTEGQKITYTIVNTSGGALGAVTWGAAFKMAAWTSPGNGLNRVITFRYNGTNWYESSRTTVDVPN